jgi:hypothetical protein
MDEHPDNSSANQLRGGVEESKLLDAVRLSGYPLQSLVAQELAPRFTVVEEWGYTDRTSKEHRSLDIYAFRTLGPDGDATASRLHLLAECKRSDLPFVFFPPGVPRRPADFPELLGFGRFSLDLGNNTTQDTSPATFFCAAELPFVSTDARVAVAFTRAERKGKALDLSGEVPFSQVILPLASAVEHVRAVFGGGPSGSGSPIIVLALCVVDAPMVMASGSPEAPSLRLDPWVRVVRQESVHEVNHWRRQHYTVDFVHRSFLSSYLERHALPFADALATRFKEHRGRSPKTETTRPKDMSWERFMNR